MLIELQNTVGCSHLPSLNHIEHWVNTATTFIHDKNDLNQMELTIRVVDEKESAYLNETFRHKKGPTNVLSFSDTLLPGFEPDSIGDLAICAELVVKEAEAQNKSVEAHWAHLIIHGFLHLLGFDHEQEEEAEKMEGLETKIMTALGFPAPYQ